MFPTPPFPLAGLLPALASVPNYHSNPITQRVRRKRQRLPPSLLIENASDVFLAFQNIACPRRFRSRLATTRPGSYEFREYSPLFQRQRKCSDPEKSFATLRTSAPLYSDQSRCNLASIGRAT